MSELSYFIVNKFGRRITEYGSKKFILERAINMYLMNTDLVNIKVIEWDEETNFERTIAIFNPSNVRLIEDEDPPKFCPICDSSYVEYANRDSNSMYQYKCGNCDHLWD